MRRFVISFFVLIYSLLCGQSTYEIKNFSKKYFAVLTIAKGYEDEVFKKGEISIYETENKKKIITVESEEFTFDTDEKGEVKTNVLELPYGEQSIIIYEDFNLDDVPDLAIMDGQHSCYHGPSFLIYLSENNQLKLSPEFTRLAQEYCGMFSVDKQEKRIYTMTKDGCCWHQFSTFKIENNQPKLILQEEEGILNFPFFTEKVTQWDENGVATTQEGTYLDLGQEGVSEVLSFKLKNNKEVILYNINDQTLNYALLRPDGLVEFFYPIEAVYENPDFRLNKAESQLTFHNKEATYKIYVEESKKVGIKVELAGKIYDLKGDVKTLKGKLGKIKTMGFHNVVIE